MKCGLCRYHIPDEAKICAHCHGTLEYYFDWSKIENVFIGGFIGFLAAGLALNITNSGWVALIAFIICLAMGIGSCQNAIVTKGDLSEKCVK